MKMPLSRGETKKTFEKISFMKAVLSSRKCQQKNNKMIIQSGIACNFTKKCLTRKNRKKILVK